MIISLCIVMLVIMAETTADLLAVGEIIGTDVDKKRIAAGLRADMGATAMPGSSTASRSAPSPSMVALTGIRASSSSPRAAGSSWSSACCRCWAGS